MLAMTTLVFTACVHEEGDIFDKSAAERLNEASALYSARLGASVNGWAMQYYPTTDNEYPYGNGYLILMDFNNDGSVTVSMNNQFTDNTYLTDKSLWQVITDDGPVLSFNTYNKCMHAFSNPEDVPFTGTDDDPNDEQGVGVGGDYEFIIVDAPEDASYMMLKGKKRGTYNLLTPVEEGVEYESYLQDIIDFNNLYFPADAPTYDLVYFGEDIYKMEGANDGIPNIYPFDGDPVANESFNPFLITKRGEDYYLRFRDAQEVGEDKVQDFRYDKEKDAFVSVENANYYITGNKAADFFYSTIIGEITHSWTFSATSTTMSDEFATLYNNIVADFASIDYTLKAMSFQYNNEKLTFRVTCTYREKQGTRWVQKTANYNYTFKAEQNGDNVVFTYEGTDNAGQLVINKFPSVNTIVQTIANEYTITPAVTSLNLKYLRFTNTANDKIWFDAEYK